MSESNTLTPSVPAAKNQKTPKNKPATAAAAKPDPYARPMPPVGWTVGFWLNGEKRGEMVPATVLRANGYQLRILLAGSFSPLDGIYQFKHPYLQAKPQLAAKIRGCWDFIPGFEAARLFDPKVQAAIAAAATAGATSDTTAPPATDSI